MVKFVEKDYKSILNKLKYIDSWFWGRYTINPYNGCQFGCTYCDARSAKYHMPEDFENQILIKQEVGPMLDGRLSRARTLLPDVVVIGGVTDGYQPVEKKFENTRRILEVLYEHEYPVHIITKSPLVLRDLDILEAIAQKTWAAVSFTVTTVDEDMAAFVDFRAPKPAKRLEAVKRIKSDAPSIKAGVLLIPLIPVLCDSEQAIHTLLHAAKTAHADYVLFGGAMTLRDVQAVWFLDQLMARYPEAYAAYKALYGFQSHTPSYTGRYVPEERYLSEKNQLFISISREIGLPIRIPRFIPADWRRANYQIAERMLNRAYLNQINGKGWEKLFWAGQNIQNLKEPIEQVASRGDLGSIRNVEPQIQSRIQDILAEGGNTLSD